MLVSVSGDFEWFINTKGARGGAMLRPKESEIEYWKAVVEKQSFCTMCEKSVNYIH